MPIMTVLGPIAANEAGFTLAHEHLLCDLWRVYPSYDGILDDEELATQELQGYLKAGGQSIVDVTSEGLGRNPDALRRIAEATGANIVMGAGWYREDVYPQHVIEKSTNELADLIVQDLTVGANGSQVRAGVIGEIGTERYFITPAQERVFRASSRAQRKTGAPIWTHTTHFGELALEQIALLREEGVPADRIVISHLGDRHSDRGLLAIAEQGVFLGIDNIGYLGDGYPTDQVRAKNVVKLIKEGHLDRILLSGDICMKQHLTAFGGKGYCHIIKEFVPILKKEQVSDQAIHRMTVTNPARVLNVDSSSIMFRNGSGEGAS